MAGRGSEATGTGPKAAPREAPRRLGPVPSAPRRAVLLGLLVGPGLAACGFAPAYGPGGTGNRLRGRVAVETPDTPDGFTLGARLEDRLGRAPDGAGLRLVADLSVETVPAAVTPGGAITRYDLVGRAPWRLVGPGGPAGRGSVMEEDPFVEAAPVEGLVVAQGEATAFTGYSATGTTVATTAAEADARGRLMTLLADAVVTRLLVLPPASLPGATEARP